MLTTEHTSDPSVATPRWRRPAALVAAAAAVLAIGVGSVLATGGGSSPAKSKTTLALKGPAASRPGMNACIIFSVDLLKEKPVAFGGTVTSASQGSATIAVDHWFKGGSADLVTISVPGFNTADGSVQFVEGKRYLVTATDGTVNACGYTGEATADLETAFEQAFTP